MWLKCTVLSGTSLWVFNIFIFCWLVYCLTRPLEAYIYFEILIIPAWVFFAFPIGYEVWHFYCTFPGFFCPYDFGSYSFTRLITVWAYTIAGFGAISLTIFILPTQWSTCLSLVVRLFVSIQSECAPYISYVATMYDSSYLRR